MANVNGEGQSNLHWRETHKMIRTRGAIRPELMDKVRNGVKPLVKKENRKTSEIVKRRSRLGDGEKTNGLTRVRQKRVNGEWSREERQRQM